MLQDALSAKRLLLFFGFGILSGVLLLYKLGSLPGGMAAAELTTIKGTTLLNMLRDPLHLPGQLLQYVVRFLPNGPLSARLPSVVVALVSLACMTYILRRWYGARTATLGFLLFVCASSFLAVSRIATFDVFYLLSLPLLLTAHIALYNAYQDEKPKTIILYAWWAIMIFLLFIPGMAWFVLLNVVWQRKEILYAIKQARPYHAVLALVIALIGVAPLAYGLYTQASTTYLLAWLGLPSSMPSIMEIPRNVFITLLAPFVRAPLDPLLRAGQLPLLDIFTTLMVIAGGLFYASHLRARRTLLLISLSLLSAGLLSTGGSVSLVILVPLLYIIALAGIAYLLHTWMRVFPRNTLARRLGIGVMAAVIALSCVYSLRAYFVAWPYNSTTFKTFDESYRR